MSLPGSHVLELEAPVRRKKDPPQSRKRARDEGTVTPLGVEVSTSIYAAVKRACKEKSWSKRTLVEKALRHYLTKEGFPPEDSE